MAIKKNYKKDETQKEEIPFEESKVENVNKENVSTKKSSAASKNEKVIEKSVSDLSQEQLIDMFKKLQEEINELKKRKEIENDAYYDDEDLTDDYLEVPAIFFSFSSWFGLYSDKRRNREILPPGEEPIIFQKLYRYPKRVTSKGVEVVSVSQAVIRSKRQAEWLRNHSLFGIKFFESMDKAKNVNVTLAEKMVEQNAKVSAMNDYQVIERLKREGLPITTSDMSESRKTLIRHLAEKSLKNEKERVEMEIKNADYDENGRRIEIKKI